jgi:hypothetical protein
MKTSSEEWDNIGNCDSHIFEESWDNRGVCSNDRIASMGMKYSI